MSKSCPQSFTAAAKLITGRFGNFIGEAEESEDDSQHGIDAGAYVYDDYPEEAPEVTGQELMEIDGWWPLNCCQCASNIYCR
jgi:hypothetical protein